MESAVESKPEQDHKHLSVAAVEMDWQPLPPSAEKRMPRSVRPQAPVPSLMATLPGQICEGDQSGTAIGGNQAENPLDTTPEETDAEGPEDVVVEPMKKAVFADVSAMKEQVRASLAKKEYNVSEFYKTKGISQWVARSSVFEQFTLLVIGLNAIWIWIDTDYNTYESLVEAPPIFQVMEQFFCIYFSFELCFRFFAFRSKRDCFKDSWFVFDACLVSMMVLETWGLQLMRLVLGSDDSRAGIFADASALRLLRLVRLTRMARMAKLLWAMPELMILIKGILVASRSVFFALCLLVLVHYVFGIAFKQLTSTMESLQAKYFMSTPRSMMSLLLFGCFGENMPDIVEDLRKENWWLVVLFMIHVILANLTVMNMLVGILCEVVSVVSAVEKETVMVGYVKTKLMELVTNVSSDKVSGENKISKDDFQMLLMQSEAAKVIDEVGVDVVGLFDFVDFIWKDGSALSIADVMSVILDLRGSNTATVKDIVDLRKYMYGSLDEVKSSLNAIANKAQCLQSAEGAPRDRNMAQPALRFPADQVQPLKRPAMILPSFSVFSPKMWASEDEDLQVTELGDSDEEV
eukprot:TRINITY_DN14394_c0_g1_i1.p1 TRINITY_DN14394_c0_g1~~TRINITY_DN14394_c0_g1_i1.p1  ORF type:complete len:652 (-),score=178.72 TRINITY_DN14394_c0_g1_i1:124-1854(-)